MNSWILYSGIAVGMFALASLRYLIMTGVYYGVVSKLFSKYLWRFKINRLPTSKPMMGLEIKWALINKINFSIFGCFTYFLYEMGYLKLYFDWNERGTWYGIAIIGVLLLIHDAYFFWLHYLMHHTRFRRFFRHHIHHQVNNVSAWSAFSVHPIEGFFEVALRSIVLLTIPMHPLTFLAFELISFALNIIGHSGYEFFPKNFASSAMTRMNSCATFHYMHHQSPGHNLSLFFNFWDRLMGTLHPNYETFYAEIHDQSQAGGTPALALP